jgi:hypothetical protein
VDVKDATGAVSLGEAAGVPLVTMQPASSQLDMAKLQAFRREGGWLIGRVTLFLDPCLAGKRPDLAIRRPNGALYDEGGGGPCGGARFTSPYLEEVWDYNAAIARKAIAAGFDEIQLDYVRFPDQPLEALDAPHPEGPLPSRIEAITVGVMRMRAALPREAVLSADVFGRTVRERDPLIGQDLRLLAPYLDYVSPMLYPSLWMAGSFGLSRPVEAPYKTISGALEALAAFARESPCFPRVRPWLETGDWPGQPNYGPKETRAQIDAARALHVRDWMLWNEQADYAAIVGRVEGK